MEMRHWEIPKWKQVAGWAFGSVLLSLLVPEVGQATNGLNLIAKGADTVPKISRRLRRSNGDRPQSCEKLYGSLGVEGRSLA